VFRLVRSVEDGRQADGRLLVNLHRICSDKCRCSIIRNKADNWTDLAKIAKRATNEEVINTSEEKRNVPEICK
jgi:hypothetical protein